MAALAAVLVALALSGTGDRRRGDRAGPVQITSIAVLPFENLSGDPEQDYFVDGMTDALITNLAQVRALRVISRTSVMQYKRTNKLLPRIADELNVDAVVEGTVMRSGDRVRVTAQLIHAPTDRHLWARTYERELRDVLALQAELAGAIAQAVEVKVRPEERRRLAARGAVNPDAYDAYLKGRFFLERAFAARTFPRRSNTSSRRSSEIPPMRPPIRACRTPTACSGCRVVPPRECMPKAEAAARKALALDDTLAEAHASLAGVLYRYQWDWEGAEREFQLSLELDPNYAEGHRAYADLSVDGAPARGSRRRGPARAGAEPALPGHQRRAGERRWCARAVTTKRSSKCRRRWRSIRSSPARTRRSPGRTTRQGDRPRAVAALEKAVLSLRSGRPIPGSGMRMGSPGDGARRWRYWRGSRSSPASTTSARRVSPSSTLASGTRTRPWPGWKRPTRSAPSRSSASRVVLFDRLSDDPRFQDLLRRMRLPAVK